MSKFIEHSYTFEKLSVWQDARFLLKEIYTLTNSYPKTETFSLISQLRRAAIYVSSNIAEGSSRRSKKDQARFSLIAFSSLMEVVNQLIISVDLGYMDETKYEELKPKFGILSAQINNLGLSQLK